MAQIITFVGVMWMTSIAVNCVSSSKTIYLARITAYGGSYNSSGMIPAEDLAIEHINNQSSVLPGYTLAFTELKKIDCDRTAAFNAFFSSFPLVNEANKTNVIALVCCGCSVATETVAEISHRWNISQITDSTYSDALSDRTRFPNFFRLFPNSEGLAFGILSVIKHFNWTRTLLLTQQESLFIKASNDFKHRVNNLNSKVTVTEYLFSSDQNNFTDIHSNYFDTQPDYRVIIVNTYSDVARKILCEAKNRKYPKYVWILYGWYAEEWWTSRVSLVKVNCTDEEMLSILERALLVLSIPKSINPDKTTISGFTANQIEQQYEDRRIKGSYILGIAPEAAYDTIWTMALALNKTAAQRNANGTGCESLNGTLNITLDNFTYDNAKFACVLKNNLASTNFFGASGNVTFDSKGTLVLSLAQILQYRQAAKVFIGYSDYNSDLGFITFGNQTIEAIYPGGVPSDGTPRNMTSSFLSGIVYAYYTLASIGVLLTIGFCAFNFHFRDRKIVRITSPNLNYFIIVGVLMMYIFIFINMIQAITFHDIRTICILKQWFSICGYVLAFGTILAKMWRINYIIRQPTPSKLVPKDWHLMIIIMVITGLAALILLLGSVVPQLAPSPRLIMDKEIPAYQDKENGIQVNYYVYTCHRESSPSYYWFILLETYLGVLQIVGIVMAFQSSKIKIAILNDSKYVGALIYISSIATAAIVLTTYGLDGYLNVKESLISGAYCVLATSFLGLVFIPKAMSLYRNPMGEDIFKSTVDKTSDTNPNAASGANAIITKNKEKTDLQMHEGFKDKELSTEISEENKF